MTTKINRNDIQTNKRSPFSSIKLMAHFNKIQELLNGNIPYPIVAEIFPSRYCPFNCHYCLYKNVRQRSPKFIDKDLLQNLLSGLKSKNIQSLLFSGGGEPLSYPDIANYFSKAHYMNFDIGLITNGYYLKNSVIAESIVKYCRWCRISLDAATNKTYTDMHGNALNISELCKYIQKILKQRGDNKLPKIGVKFLITHINIHEIEQAAELSAELEVDYIQFKVLKNPYSTSVTNDQYSKINDSIEKARIKVQSSQTMIYGNNIITRVNKACEITPLHAVIDTDGVLYLCPFFDIRLENHKIGNLSKSNFCSIWGTELHHEAIKKIKPSECNHYNCSSFEYHSFIDQFIKNDPLCVNFP